MTKRLSGVVVLALALSAYGCGETANGGSLGGEGGSAGMAGEGGMGGMAGEGGMGGMAGEGGMGGMAGMGGTGGTPDLCMDVVCDDENECTDDSCDPADGMCDFEDVTDGTSCDFGALPGVCMTGVCEDAMLCDEVDCSDENECTDDICDQLDGSCGNPSLPDGTDCDADGLPGECDSGSCVATCAPAPGQMVMLPRSGDPTPTYTDMPNGFTISAANCSALPKCDVTFSSPRGVGANAFGDALRIEPGDSLRIEFFDLDGNERDASNVSIGLYVNGIGGIVSVTVDGGAAMSMAANPGQALDLPGPGHTFEVTLTNDVPTAYHHWSVLSYDHECL